MTATDLHPDTGVPRPGTCCGACPPIAGGGWDCTCAGNPRCPVNSPAADWITDLARLAERATPGEWTTYAAYGSRGVEVVDTEDMLFIQDGGVTYAVNEADAEFIAAANPAVVLRLIRELQQQRHRTAEFQTIAAGFANRAVAAEDRLAAVEALSWELSPADGPRLRAALAAPTDTTKEN